MIFYSEICSRCSQNALSCIDKGMTKYMPVFWYMEQKFKCWLSEMIKSSTDRIGKDSKETHMKGNEWMIGIWFWTLPGLMHLGLKTGPLCPMFCTKLELCSFSKVSDQMAPVLSFLISSGSKKKEPRCVCLSEAKASHSHKMWTEVSSSLSHFLQMGLLLSPIIYIDVFSRCCVQWAGQ